MLALSLPLLRLIDDNFATVISIRICTRFHSAAPTRDRTSLVEHARRGLAVVGEEARIEVLERADSRDLRLLLRIDLTNERPP